MTSTIISAVVGFVAVIGAALGLWFGGKSKGAAQKQAELQPQVDAAKAQTAAVVQQSKDADEQVKQAASDKSAQVDAVLKTIDERVNSSPEGDAQKQLQDKYSRD